MTAISQSIELHPILPAVPIVVCGPNFLHSLAEVEREIAHYKITNAQDYQGAANLLNRLTTAGGALEKARKTVKAPFLAKCDEIDAAAKAPALRIEQAKALVKSKVTAFDLEQQRVAQETERARQAELKRLEAVRREEERIAREKADELASIAAEAATMRDAAFEVPDFDDGSEEPAVPQKTAVEVEIERVKFAPSPVVAKPVGVAFKSRLIISGIDASKLPEAFITRVPKEQAIRATFCVGWRPGDSIPECPGVTFREDRQVSSTGRTEF